MKTLIYTLTIVLLCATIAHAQSKNQIIVQLHKDNDVKELAASYQFYKGQNTELYSKQLLSKKLNIWLLEFNEKKVKPRELLAEMKTNHAVNGAQMNYEVKFRAIPNDPLYTTQWQYANDGSDYGVADADIDAPEAWDITTGGTTVTGEEIVIAIVDGGVDLNHPDLRNNIWTNTQEIPDNGIDDDNNGFVDDFYGWNFNENTNNVGNDGAGSWHGSPVMGILGAEGNNGIGVTGVNWNVKVMNLVGNSDDASVVAAYSYMLEMRTRYNESNGEEGAFVVATNASLGRSGHPDDAPIWCSMYDELGAAGIVSAGATSNSSINVDIDERGDIPTTCPSEYLISVTNTNNRDETVGAGYGAINIDLAAPGAGAFTVRNLGGEDAFGGTSAATPHVAGTIGLLYSAPVPEFMDDVHQSPNETARRVRNFILQGVDQVADLQGITVTGGRLNLYNSLRNLEEYYGIEGELFPSNAVFINTISPNPTSDNVEVEVKLFETTSLTLKIYNSFGQMLRRESIGRVDRGLHRRSFSFKDMPKGVYFITATANNFGTVVGQKIIVE